jgi:NDP-sugar pyrophosphorylase family protein
MRAVILAGGRGTRLAPLTTVFPKPLVPIGDETILEIVIRQLRRHGIDDLVLSVGHLGSLIMAYFGNGERHKVRIEYAIEELPLGTAGPLATIDGLTSSFVVMNGDVLSDVNFTDMYDYHRRSGAAVTVGICPRSMTVEFGVIESTPSGELSQYIEKPRYDYFVSMGIYIMEPVVLDFLSRGTSVGLPDLVTQLVAGGKKVMCYEHRGYWLDIGRKDDYERALREWPHIAGT